LRKYREQRPFFGTKKIFSLRACIFLQTWYNGPAIKSLEENGVIVMKATGVVRRVDELGRVVLPCELRRVMNIKDRDSLEIFVDEDKIVLKKYEPACTFTGSADELLEYKGRRVSKQAITEMAKAAGLL